MVHLAGSTPRTGPAPAGQGCIVETAFAGCLSASGQHTAEVVVIAEVGAGVDAEAGVEAGVEVDAAAAAAAGVAAGAGVDAEAGAAAAREVAG